VDKKMEDALRHTIKKSLQARAGGAGFSFFLERG
jgi:hypothetical protein